MIKNNYDKTECPDGELGQCVCEECGEVRDERPRILPKTNHS